MQGADRCTRTVEAAAQSLALPTERPLRRRLQTNGISAARIALTASILEREVGAVSVMDIWRSDEEACRSLAAGHVAVGLPFRGRAESYQLLGVGRWEVARRLCEARGLSPVRCGEQAWALVQLSLMKWKQSPVGPYWASFVGISARNDDGEHPPNPRGERPPRGAAVLSQFLRAPKVLLVPTYVVGEVLGAPPGGANRSRQFGTDVLGIEKSTATFTVTKTPRQSHVHVLERRMQTDGRTILTGYTLTLSARRGRSSVPLPALPISPRLLLARGLVTESLRALVQPEVKGAFVFPAPDGGPRNVYIGTRFASRPRLFDLSNDARTSFSPIVMDRPAPASALGALLDELDFSPRVLMWDPDLAGTIVGPAPSLADAIA